LPASLRSPLRDVAGRWASPPPPRPSPSPAGPRGLPSGPRHPRSEELRRSTLVILAPVQGSWSARIISDRLPWDSSGLPALAARQPFHPSIDLPLGVHSGPTGPPHVAARHLVWLRQRGLHPRRSRSVHVVSHHLDGFLRRGRSGHRAEARWDPVTPRGCGLVASRCRSWGSLCFLLRRLGLGSRRIRSSRRSHSPQRRPLGSREPHGRSRPLEEAPSLAAVLRHRSRCPPGVRIAPRIDCAGCRFRPPASSPRHASVTFRALLRARVL
jgi:hypothetical protein